MFAPFLSSLAALLLPGPAVPAADSPVRAHGDALVFSAYDIGRDTYRLTVRRGRASRVLATGDEPFDADLGPAVVFARDGTVFDEDGARVGLGRAPSVWRGTVAAVRGDDVLIGERVVARVRGVTELELRGDRLAIASPAGLTLLDGGRRRLVARGPGVLGVSLVGDTLAWYRRGEHRLDLATGRRTHTPGPADVSGYALLPGGRSVRVEPEGEDGRLRFSG